MSNDRTPDEARRRFLRALAATPIALATPSFLAGCTTANGSTVAEESLQPTIACDDGDDDDPTISQTEGPFFTPRSPRRISLIERGMRGTPMALTGMVLTRSCRPVVGALVDFWHCDDAGVYDNAGYTLRGHQFTNEQGIWTLETIVPGIYPGRTRHFHVKVQAPAQPVLTTQLYFPGDSRNTSDGIFHQSLLMKIGGSAEARTGRFNFVLDLP